MSDVVLPEDQVDRTGGRIVLVVLDGLGGLPHPSTGKTELETAKTPNLDALAGESSLGMSLPVAQGITPGSGPGHLSLFGYDPTEWVIGRGILSALGVGLELEHGDVAARLNIASFDGDGRVTDRRAGRPSDEEGRRVVEKVMAGLPDDWDFRLELTHEKEHRVVLWIRGEGLGGDLSETDPLETGLEPHDIEALSEGSQRTARIVRDFLERSRKILEDEEACHGFLARGFAAYDRIPTIDERFGLRGTAIAKYPMYRGVARLVGMSIDQVPDSVPATAETVPELWDLDRDFWFVHFKDPDTKGHDRDFDGKVAAIEAVDAVMPSILSVEPEVVVVTGDHSTPAIYGEHSWHRVPTLVRSQWSRPTSASFGESACRVGDMGAIHGTEIMPLALAHAGRLVKFGA